MLPIQSLFPSVSSLSSQLAVSQPFNGSQFGSASLLPNDFPGIPQAQFNPPQFLNAGGFNPSFVPQTFISAQPSQPLGQINLSDPQARQALLQQLRQTSVAMDPSSPESRKLQARIGALSNVSPDGSFTPIGQLFQQLTLLEPGSPEALSVQAKITVLEEESQSQISKPQPQQSVQILARSPFGPRQKSPFPAQPSPFPPRSASPFPPASPNLTSALLQQIMALLNRINPFQSIQ